MQVTVRENPPGDFELSLRGELDHHAAGEVIAAIRRCAAAVPLRRLRLELGGVGFSDSSGIAVVLLAAKSARAAGAGFCMHNVPPQMERLFRTAGVERLLAAQVQRERITER